MEELITENTAPAPEEKESSGWGRFFLDVLETILLAAALFLVINAISARVRVDGTSMLPTLQDGEFVLVNRLAYRFGQPQRGDIVVFHYPTDPKQEDLIKRVIGLPGDEVKVENGAVYVNGIRLKEPYIAAAPAYDGTWPVPEGSLFVLGDNRNKSSDSHAWGFVPYEDVVGKSFLIYWPLTDWTIIDHVDLLKASQ